MDIDLADLPDNVETLQWMVRTLATERANLTEAQAEIERLRLIVQKLQRSQFGRRAERLDDDSSVLKTSMPTSRGSKPRFHQRRSRRRDAVPEGVSALLGDANRGRYGQALRHRSTGRLRPGRRTARQPSVQIRGGRPSRLPIVRDRRRSPPHRQSPTGGRALPNGFGAPGPPNLV